jgi:tRNA pseudouridine38-40 synthase
MDSDPVPAPVRMVAVVSYDGSGFHGVAINPGVRTVLGEFVEAVERCTGAVIECVCAGRTDTGVHARAQVLSFDLPPDTDAGRLQRSLNALLHPEVVVLLLQPAPSASFHARFDASWRQYRYFVLNRAVDDPFLGRTAWHVADPLALDLMNLACDPLIGEHDFSSFCRRVGDGSMTRRVMSARWHPSGPDVVCFEIRASAFCQQMVRSIVGLLVDVGRGRRRAGEVAGIQRARNRAGVGQLAPPRGLFLWTVGFEGWTADELLASAGG